MCLCNDDHLLHVSISICAITLVVGDESGNPTDEFDLIAKGIIQNLRSGATTGE